MRRKKLEEYPNPNPTTLFKRDRDKEAAKAEPAKNEHLHDHNIGATLKLCSMMLTSWMKNSEPTVIPAHNNTGLKTVKPVKMHDHNGTLTDVQIILSPNERMFGKPELFAKPEIVTADGRIETIQMTAYQRTNLVCEGAHKNQEVLGAIDVPFVIGHVEEKKIYPTFKVTIPGSKTVLSYNAETGLVAITDEVMTEHYDSSKHAASSMLPNAADPRIASEIYARLETVCDATLGNLIPSLQATSTDWVDQDHDQRKTLFGFTVQGHQDILQLINVLEQAFQKYKGQVLPLEQDAEKKIRLTA